MKNVTKKAVCLHFEVHQPFRLKRYRFFDLGNDHYYYDDYANESIMQRIATRCYLPAINLLLDLIHKHKGKFRMSFSISGLALDQFQLYAPEVLKAFKELADTGSVEFLAETDSHSLSSLRGREEFEKQIAMHNAKLVELLGVKPTAIRNTEMIYSDQIGEWMADMGYKVALTEGTKHILGWKSPNFLYCNATNPRLKVLLRNFVLSDDIAFRFSNREWCEWPLTATKYAGWINSNTSEGEVVNIFMDFETFGEHHKKETGIFDFLAHLPGAILKKANCVFMTPSEVADNFQPVSAIQVPSPISWADEERDLTAWLGNELQTAAFEKLYELSARLLTCATPDLMRDWTYLQSSDHFYYMSTKFFSDGAVHAYFNPYETPYDAFMNYMNILSDFEIRINREVPCSDDFIKFRKMKESIAEKDLLIKKQANEIAALKKVKQQVLAAKELASDVKKPAAALKKLAAAAKKPAAKTTTKKVAAKATAKKVAARTTAKKVAVKPVKVVAKVTPAKKVKRATKKKL